MTDSTSRTQPDHIAFVVRSIEQTLARMGLPDLHDDIEEFPSEGTRELYVGQPDQPGKLLLMQPIADGPYQRALDKRGEGLHHVALFAGDIPAWLSSPAASGWFLHPSSLQSFARAGCVWLCRPGVGCLIELNQGVRRFDAPAFIERTSIPVTDELQALVARLGVDGLVPRVNGDCELLIDGQRHVIGGGA